MERNSGGGFLFGFILGGLVGAALAILFAPQSGKETQTMIREKSIELKDQISEISPEEVKEVVSKGVQEAIKEGKAVTIRAKEEVLRMQKGAPDSQTVAEETTSGAVEVAVEGADTGEAAE